MVHRSWVDRVDPVAVAAAAWSIRHWNLEVTYHLHRPRVRVAYPSGRASAANESAAREEATLSIAQQQIEDNANRA